MMAQLSFNYPDDLLKQLDRAAADATLDKMVNAALPIMKKSLDQELSRHERTGALRRSMKVQKSKAFKHGNAHYGLIKPTGKDERGIKNGVKLAVMTYGSSKQPATDVIGTAMRRCEGEVMTAVQNAYNQEISKKG